MNVNQNRTVRIFLSSTFRDFDDERRLLVQEVFPALRERLRSRFVELVDVDLRWGIPPEEAEQGKVLSICLDEIDQCRPYFIGLLGERYGWIPAQDTYPGHLVDQHPWLNQHQGQASVTELEIRYGVLNNADMRHRALFFFRNPNYAYQRGGEFVPPAGKEVDRERQNTLKQQIERSGFPVLHFDDPSQLADLISSELWALIDQEFPATQVPDPHELKTLNHRAFAASKLGPRFVRDTAQLERIGESILQGKQRILLTGPAGIGKSSLLADWWRQEQAPNAATVLCHFLETDQDNGSSAALIRRLIELIRRTVGSSEPVPEESLTLRKSLPIWLAEAQTYAERTATRLVIILDGLDRLRSGRDLLWLPTFIPPSVQLVVSCRPGEIQKALKRRGDWHVLELGELEHGRREALLVAQLKLFKKELSEQQATQILRHARAGQPLFLCTLSEQLRLFGSFEGLPAHLEDLLASAEIDDLFEKILARLERHYSAQAVRQALSALCLSDSGLTEEEVLGFSGLNVQARWAPIRLALGEALSNNSGRIRPSHDHLRKAVRDRYFPEKTIEQGARIELARWFSGRPLNRRRAWEQPQQLWRAGDYEELEVTLSDATMFRWVDRLGGSRRLYRYWADIEAASGRAIPQLLRALWERWRSELPLDTRIDLSECLQRLLRFAQVGADLLVQLV